jgi:hypothetical protein
MPKAVETGDHPGCSVVVVVGGTVVVVVRGVRGVRGTVVRGAARAEVA